MKIIREKSQDLSHELIFKIESLLNVVWPPKESQELSDQVIINNYHNLFKDSVIFYIEKDGVVISHAKVFPRIIIREKEEQEVMALSGVCVLPEKRGLGLGKMIVKEVFKLIDNKEYNVSLFQTTVPEFYKKIGARIVNNQFLNSKNQKDPQTNPWWDPYVMIYPNDYPWSDLPIDLNGSGY